MIVYDPQSPPKAQSSFALNAPAFLDLSSFANHMSGATSLFAGKLGLEALNTHIARRALEVVEAPFGISFDTDAPQTVALYVLLTVVVNGFVPVPLASVMCALGVVLYGWFYGFILNLVASVTGCCLGLAVFRLFRPFFLSMLGEHTATWSAIDNAISQEGYRIPLLLRLTPVMPVVLTNAMLSLTSVDAFTYAWTTMAGFIPASIPYAYTAVVGEAVLNDFPPKDPVMISVSLLGLAATLLAVWKLGSIASAELKKAGVGQTATTTKENENGAHGGEKMMV